MSSKTMRQMCASVVLMAMLVLIVASFSELCVCEPVKGVLYKTSRPDLSMTGNHIPSASLGAISTPGWSITSDYRVEAVLRNQQYEVKCIVIYFTVFAICCFLWNIANKKTGNFKKVDCRLLI